MIVKLNQQQIDRFAKFAKGYNAKFLLEYLEKLRLTLFDPETLTADNLQARKEAQELLDVGLIDPIKRIRSESEPTSGHGDYE